ncbi:hypothetical protein OMCYN_01190 [cyanobiont of Ornithocercus magnificus]|nr:hypothetical protein OMCYN_01190 [cyanobiont of Ornithocercus magnificus]
MVTLRVSYALLQEAYNFYLANKVPPEFMDIALYELPTPILYSLTYYLLNIILKLNMILY